MSYSNGSAGRTGVTKADFNSSKWGHYDVAERSSEELLGWSKIYTCVYVCFKCATGHESKYKHHEY